MGSLNLKQIVVLVGAAAAGMWLYNQLTKTTTTA